MNWNAVKDVVGNAAPIVGSLLGGPAGAAVGGLISKALGVEEKPEAVIQALQGNPDAIVKVKELELSKELAEIQANLQSKQIDADVTKTDIQATASQSGAVNTTMQEEAKSEHWPTYSWRPFIGFVFGITLLLEVIIVGGLVVMAVLTNHYEILANIPAIVGAFSVLLAVPLPILGVASYFRGKAQADPNIPNITLNRG